MRLADARAVAADWVASAAVADLVGAFVTGSAGVDDPTAELASTSDVDVVLVTDGPAPDKLGKLWHGGVLLDVSAMSAAELDVETIAGTSYLAPAFAAGMVIADRADRLGVLQREVAAVASRPEWIRRRVAEVRSKITNGLDRLDSAAPLAQQVAGWVFPASLPTVLLLVAAGRPPTVRKRYLRCRELLAAQSGAFGGVERPGLPASAPLELYERLLAALGCADVTADRVRHHLDELADTLAIAVGVARTPLPFSSDLRPDTWHLTLDGSAELVDAGWPREAVWWVLATYARCVTVLRVDGSAEQYRRHERRLGAATLDLIGFGAGDGPERAVTVRRLLPAIDALVEDLVDRSAG